MNRWLKYGLITLSIFIACIIIVIIGYVGCGWNPVDMINAPNNAFCKNLTLMIIFNFIPLGIAILLGGFLFVLIGGLIMIPNPTGSIIITILSLIVTILIILISIAFSFGVGALIGWVVSKIKKDGI